MRFHITLLSVLLGLGAVNTFADEESVYLGLKGGAYSQDGVTPSDMANIRYRNWAWGAFAGYSFALPLATEIEYVVLTEDDDEDPDDLDFEGSLFAASLKPRLTFGKHAELFAKIGWSWVDGELRDDLGGPAARDMSVSRDGFLAGVGAAWNFRSLSLRLEYQFSDIDIDYVNNADTELLTLGVSYRF